MLGAMHSDGDPVMSDEHAPILDQAEEESLTCTVCDEALEAAASLERRERATWFLTCSRTTPGC